MTSTARLYEQDPSVPFVLKISSRDTALVVISEAVEIYPLVLSKQPAVACFAELSRPLLT